MSPLHCAPEVEDNQRTNGSILLPPREDAQAANRDNNVGVRIVKSDLRRFVDHGSLPVNGGAGGIRTLKAFKPCPFSKRVPRHSDQLLLGTTIQIRPHIGL